MSAPKTNSDPAIEHAELSDVGLRRTNNQDNLGVMMASTADLWRRRGHLFMVADGMGAHAAGEYASKLAVDHVPHTYHKEPDASAAIAIRKAIEEANHVIHSRGQANPDFQGMGTTCSTLILLPEGAMVAHVGDSRVYRLRGNRLDQLTFDHSLVWELKASGQISSDDDAPNYIPKNIITRSLGPNPDVKVDLEGPFPLAVGDTFMLCSDGLSGQVRDEEFAAILGALSPQEAVHALVDLANLRGGPDNITVLIAKVVAPINGSEVDAARFKEPSGPRGGLNPLVWLVPALLAAAAMGMFALRLPIVALVFVLLTVLSAVALSILASRRSGGDQNGGENFGRAPYATAIFAANASFIQDLSKVLDQLKDAARQEDWVLDWAKVNMLTTRAEEDAKKSDYVAAVRGYCRAISVFMEQLRHQRRGR
jgi:PPM family protein phosphatase